MKKYLFLIYLFPIYLCSQNYENVKVKEYYDANLESVNENVMPAPLMEFLVADGNNDDLFGDRISKVLSSLLTMYETTGDKAYLIKFVKNSFIAQNVRNDIANSSNHPGWTEGESAQTPGRRYLDGYILKSMAEFVYLVRLNPQLFSTPLPTSFLLNISSQFFPQSCITYGDYANWLGFRVNQTLDWYIDNDNWDDNKGMLDFNHDALIINMQSGFALAFFYMGNSDPRQSYQDKANVIAGLYKLQIIIDDRCNCGTYDAPVFIISIHNSYVWFDNGWTITKNTHPCVSSCFPFYSGTGEQDNLPEYVATPEDLSHGVPDLWVPLAYNRFAPNSYFDQNDMIRWRNTFAKNIYDDGDFHNNCEGNEISNVPACIPNGCPINQFRYAAFAWMPFYQWDEADNTASAPNVYDILMQLFISDFSNGTPTSFNSAYYGGFGEVVKAQWDKECVNLSMYKRDVKYDQDFKVKNALTIDPASNSTYNTANSFAEPFITTPTFTIEPNVTSNMTAGEEIILKPGFTALSGSNFTASIVPSICTDGHRIGSPGNGLPNIALQNNTTSKQNKTAIKSALPVFQNNLTIAPNPFNGTTSILFSLENKGNVTLKIINALGREVFSEIENVPTEAGNYNVPFDGNKIGTGIYFCVLQVNGEVMQTKKMVVL